MKRLITALVAFIALHPAQALATPGNGGERARERAIEAACARWQPLMRAHKLPVETFTRIAYRESRCIPKAIGWNYQPGKGPGDCKLSPAPTYRKCKAVKSYDLGLFQINSTWVTVTAQVCGTKWGDMMVLLDPACNAKVAAYLYRQGGGLSNWRATSGA